MRVFGKQEPDGVAILDPNGGAPVVFRKFNPEHATFFPIVSTRSISHDLGIEGLEPGVVATITVTVKQSKTKLGGDSAAVSVTPVLLTKVMDEAVRVSASEWVEGPRDFVNDAQGGFLPWFDPDHFELVKLANGWFMQDPPGGRF